MAYQKLCEVDIIHKIKFASGFFRLQDKVNRVINGKAQVSIY